MTSETRKLAAILVADIVGYSRLAGAARSVRLRGLSSRPHRSDPSRCTITGAFKRTRLLMCRGRSSEFVPD